MTHFVPREVTNLISSNTNHVVDSSADIIDTNRHNIRNIHNIVSPLSDTVANDDDAQPPSLLFDLTHHKELLIARLTAKIAVLVRQQAYIADETTANETLGHDVATEVAAKIRTIDVSKFRSYVDDVGHITMLLLSLSARLARTENELQIVEVGDAERVSDSRWSAECGRCANSPNAFHRNRWRSNATGWSSSWTRRNA